MDPMDNRWVLYDIPNENITMCEAGYTPTEAEIRANIIKMPYSQAEMIRRVKKLSMPMPPVKAAFME